MKNLIPLILVVFLLALLGCGDQNSVPTSAEQEQDVMSLAKKGKDKDKGKGGTPKTCTSCDAAKNIVCRSSKLLKNGATVTWTSSFGGFDYTPGDAYAVTVSWSVDQGSATFKSFTAKKKTWTPKGVGGTWSFSGNTLTVNMDLMHQAIDPGWKGYIGNGHFKLELDVTNNNIMVKAKLGVNVHLEDPGDGYDDRCP